MTVPESDSLQFEGAAHAGTLPTELLYFDGWDDYSNELDAITGCDSRGVPAFKSCGQPDGNEGELSATSNRGLRKDTLRKCFSLNSSQASDILTVIGGLSLSSKDVDDTAPHPPEDGDKGDKFSGMDIEERKNLFPCDNFRLQDHPDDYDLHWPLAQRNDLDILQRVSKCRTAQELSQAASMLRNTPHMTNLLWYWDMRKIDGHSRDHAGNTALHIAATCGAGYRCLRNLMSKSPLNALNNANQTFMHVLDPSTLVKEQSFASFLFDLLITDYNFKQGDDRGSTMLQNLLKANCWASHDARAQLFHGLAINVLDLASRDATGLSALSRLAALIKTDSNLLSCTTVDQEGLADLVYPRLISRMNHCAASGGPAGAYTIRAIMDQYDAQETPQSLDDVTSCHATYITEKDFASRVGLTPAFGMGSSQKEHDYGRNALHLLAYTMPEHNVSATRRFANDSDNRKKRRELYKRRAEQVTRLLRQGVSLHTYDKQGQTPLMAMITKLNIHDNDVARSKLIELLLRAGAQVNCRGRHDETPLHEAVGRGFFSTTGTLLKYGARPNACKADNRSVVSHAILTGQRLKPSLMSPQTKHHNRNLHLRILTCIEKVMAHGGVEFPTLAQQWSVNQTGGSGSRTSLGP